MKLANLKKGSILSETSFYKVNKVTNSGIEVTDDFGNDITIGKAYVEMILNSAEVFSTEEKKTLTELQEIFVNNPRVAMEVGYYKKDEPKTKKAYEAEKAAAIKKVQDASLSTAAAILADLIDNPISKVIPGEFRIIRGRHYNSQHVSGRINFIDMELEKGDKADYDARVRQVDPRTIQHIIVGGVKYSLK